MKKFFILALALLAVNLSAQISSAADYDSLFSHFENPAAMAVFPDKLGIGIKAGIDLDSTQDDFYNLQDFEVSMGLPGMGFRSRTHGESTDLSLIAAAKIRQLSIGMNYNWLESEDKTTSQDLGLLFRPFNFLSLSLAIENIHHSDKGFKPDYYGGLAIRPLAFNEDLEARFTLFGGLKKLYDDDAYHFNLGANIKPYRDMSIAASYDFTTEAFTLSALYTYHMSEMKIAATSEFPPKLLQGKTSAFFSSETAIRLRDFYSSPVVLGSALVLHINSQNAWRSTPPLFKNEGTMYFDKALAIIDKAAKDSKIVAINITEIPQFASEAHAQEFSRALLRFKKAGKSIYVYAKELNRRNYIYVAAPADIIALDPNGSLPLVDASFVNIYLKDFLNRFGIDTYTLRSHPTKTANNMFTENKMTTDEKEMYKNLLTALSSSANEQFKNLRGDKLKEEAETILAKGPRFDPQKALEEGLIDFVMYPSEYDKKLKEKLRNAIPISLEAYANINRGSWGGMVINPVPIVYLNGSIIDDVGEAGKSIGTSAVSTLRALADNKMVPGVIIRVDSGGGSALVSDHLAQAVRELKEAGKKVVVSMAGYAASGGYYLSALADHIVAEESTLTGSIGVTGMNINISRLLEKQEIGVDAVALNEQALFGHPLLPHREEDDKASMEMINYIYSRFVDVVAEGRDMDKERVDELGQGRVWTGKQALEYGLVDELGGLDRARAAMEELLKKKLNYVTVVPGKTNPWRSMLSSFTVSTKIPKTLNRAWELGADLEAMGSGPLLLEPLYLYR